MILKLISWNIWGGTHLQEVIDFLRKEDADIIALQEVHKYSDGNTALFIAKELGYPYVEHALGLRMPAEFVPASASQGGQIQYGPAILSKHTIVGSIVHDLSPTTKRPVIQADIQIGEQVVHVVSLHLKHTHQQASELQEEQAQNLVQVTPNEKTILMGDFNALPGSTTIKILKQKFVDTEKETTIPTWPLYKEGCVCIDGDTPIHNIDYIFTTKDIETISYEVGQTRGSDHVPIIAQVKI